MPQFSLKDAIVPEILHLMYKIYQQKQIDLSHQGLQHLTLIFPLN